MLKLLFLILLIFIQSSCFLLNEVMKEELLDENTIQIEPGQAETHFIKYEEETTFTFNITEENPLQINIHSINCNFKLDLMENY